MASSQKTRQTEVTTCQEGTVTVPLQMSIYVKQAREPSCFWAGLGLDLSVGKTTNTSAALDGAGRLAEERAGGFSALPPPLRTARGTRAPRERLRAATGSGGSGRSNCVCRVFAGLRAWGSLRGRVYVALQQDKGPNLN